MKWGSSMTFLSELTHQVRHTFKVLRGRDASTRLKAGFADYLETGQTSEETYQTMVRAYCDTNGRALDELHRSLKATTEGAKSSPPYSGVLGELAPADVKRHGAELREDGYTVFQKRLDADVISRLAEFALNVDTRGPDGAPLGHYDPDAPQAPVHHIGNQDLMNNPDVQRLICDPTLIGIAAEYLGGEPIFDFPAMWWSTTFSREASSEAAQLYHFDLDRLQWLKVFIYLSDVDQETGPHCYVRGSHRVGAKPAEVLQRGYVRIPDEDLFPHYPQSDFKTLCGPAGSIFAGDTKCWHKGTPLAAGHRLVLEFEYTSCLFGTNPACVCTQPLPEFKAFLADHERYSSNIELR